MLKPTLTSDSLVNYIAVQTDHLFPDGMHLDNSVLKQCIATALERYDECCAGITRGYFTDGRHTIFDHLNSDQYAMFLYFLCRALYLSGDDRGATKIYYLNKILHSIDVYFTVELPTKFMFSHCVGTVLGKAKYGNYLRIAQNCTVGNNVGDYPELGEGVALYKGCEVVGRSKIGNDVHISAHTLVRNQDVPDGMIAIGRSPDLVFKRASATGTQRFFYPKGRRD